MNGQSIGTILPLLVIAVSGFNVSSAEAQELDRIRVLIIEGQHNHKSAPETTVAMRKILETSGRFAVDVSTTPPKDPPEQEEPTPAKWHNWRPQFSDYGAVLINYNGEMWPASIRKEFEDYVAAGGGVVVIHAAGNQFKHGWDAFGQMVGVWWQDPDHGHRVYLDQSGRVVLDPPGEGDGTSHGRRHAFSCIVRDDEHPITKGMPPKWLHAVDELYHGQRGPAANMHILLSAYSDTQYRGSGKHEPMLWWIPYGKGRVVTNRMGHDAEAMKCVGFISTLERSCEWAATGGVNIPLPDDFPTATTSASRRQSYVPRPTRKQQEARSLCRRRRGRDSFAHLA